MAQEPLTNTSWPVGAQMSVNMGKWNRDDDDDEDVTTRVWRGSCETEDTNINY